MLRAFFLLSFFTACSLHALPLSNPSDASLFPSSDCNWLTLKFGYYGDFVFNRHLKTVTDTRIDYSSLATNAAYFAFEFWESFDFYTTLGVTKFCFNTSLAPFNPTNAAPRFNFESSSAFSWSFGGHGTLFTYRCLSLGLAWQYFRSRPEAKVIFIRNNVDIYPGRESRRTYSEWQLGAGLSYRYNDYFVPYTGLKWGRVLWEFNHESFFLTGTTALLPNLESRKDWGYVIGLILAPSKCIRSSLAVEARFIDETALSVIGQIRF